jgi:hypothetical protein
MPLRFTIRDVFLLILAVALLLGASSFLWDRAQSNIYSPLSNNAELFFSLNLALLATATCIARLSKPAISRFAVGYAVFGWAYVALVLHGGFGFDADPYHQWLLAKLSMFGPMLGLVCGIATCRIARSPIGKSTSDPQSYS